MSDTSPILVWFRRDLRLSDHAALSAACDSGRPVIPVFVHDGLSENLGAAPKWRLGLGVGALGEALEEKGSRLILRRSDQALDALQDLIKETGAGAVYWSRLYDPQTVSRDSQIKAELKEQGIDARSFGGHLMFEPWTVETKTGGYYKVYSPFWKTVKTRDVEVPRSAPSDLHPPENWPKSDALAEWEMGAEMNRGAAVVRPFVQLGEAAAQARLGHFIAHLIDGYKDNRNTPGMDGTSNLSENLSLGEISPHQCWHAGQRALQEGKRGAETFLKELVWREFAYHLMHHTPRILDQNWREEWNDFPWKDDGRAAEVWAWKKGRTGVPFVDAAMRELYVTGRMHNRARMIVASYLTKHLMTHWRIGQAWFEDCLIDWDPASNAMGWQWTAGSGPDAAPYFRVFNPVTQREKFDPDAAYVDRWIAEGRDAPHDDALAFFEACPRHWGMNAQDSYPTPIVSLDGGRKRALTAYENRKD
ncbi:deoxyribodipyrimidine photo-lyase [Sulfitobacter mediterraneus]|uniref:cryptochrome/photolyase family protein n=1 Tax=Sulfitobacter mediterraneus TaxID=83219 RepID=UPI001933E582|nr:deoxyribodipyrimidine photo-lyase [Sulfitobacter mediterraneus]MBM1632179.1 deoxyribodipyrimidine photo-lyase [Sulfitobacter mediterraneus]MBM1639995.1 deoxyribodipyrimidine photo-lyase [Sulfitobacter mediterraneus]MBM1644044.1 deoxyribodipyrimidine photo-lyase [Sulfitobacter mediterraneus]MBM1648090.1 deoxyribodipyrimidine photo-lyase [Sulfitobacter mediterraneus]MBM1652135.1 deoxyribodipyrimidine photo-lyase [Sulfitobacter mediterraneus]